MFSPHITRHNHHQSINQQTNFNKRKKLKKKAQERNLEWKCKKHDDREKREEHLEWNEKGRIKRDDSLLNPFNILSS